MTGARAARVALVGLGRMGLNHWRVLRETEVIVHAAADTRFRAPEGSLSEGGAKILRFKYTIQRGCEFLGVVRIDR